MGYGDNIAVFGARDAKMRAMLTDPPGGTATYSDWMDVPGVMDLQIDTDLAVAEAFGDDQTVAVASRLKGYKGKLGMALEALNIFATILGGTVTSAGSTPNQTSEWVNSAGDRGSKFEIVVQSSGDDDSPSSTMERTFHKCTLTKFNFGAASEKFSGPGIEFTAIARKSDGKRSSIKAYETGSALSSGSPDTTAPTCTSSPANGGTFSALTGIVTITFNEDMDPGIQSDVGTYYYANGATGAAVAFAVSVSGRTTTLTPTSNLSTGVAYDFGVTKAAKDKAGNRIAAQYAARATAP